MRVRKGSKPLVVGALLVGIVGLSGMNSNADG